MLKDTFFSLPRFVNVCRKDMVESWKTNLLRVAMMFGVMLVLFLLIGYLQYEDQGKYHGTYDSMVEFSLGVFLWVGLICGVLSASFNMEKMKSKTSRISTLMTPATQFEKFLSRWLISTVVYIVVFLILFKLADYTRVVIFSWAYPDLVIVPSKLGYIVADEGQYSLFPNLEGKYLPFMCYPLIQSFFVLGSSIWAKNSFVKTFVLGFGFVMFYVVVIGIVSHLLFRNVSWNFQSVYISGEDGPISLYIGGIFFTLFNWTLAYFRFKESEIINRL